MARKKDCIFYDPEADKVLFATLKAHLNPNVVQVVEMEDDINSENFAIAMANTLHSHISNTMKLTEKQ